MITVIGESLVDIISDPRRPQEVQGQVQGNPPQAHPGGSPLNVAGGVARLGLATNLVTHYAEDRYGLMIEGHLHANGVTTIQGGSAPTSTATATLSSEGAATYVFDISWDITGASLPALAAVEASSHVHTGSIAAVLAPGDQATLALVRAARDHATVSFDPNCRPGISPDVAAARAPDRTPEESMAAWLELGPALVALTRGGDGPVIIGRGGRVEMPGETITVADTVGAGDSFMAGLISGLAQLDALGAPARARLRSLAPRELHTLAAYANRAAAITCSRPGATPPTSAELGSLTGSLTASEG